MSITTKTGDKGFTSLLRGKRVPKDDIRVHIYGELDELCSFLGLSRSLIKDRLYKELIAGIQRDLFVIGAEIGTEPGYLKNLEERIDKNYVKRLERAINNLENKSKAEVCCFLLPGENTISATLDVARTVSRRAERKIVSLKNKKILQNSYIQIYLNRLSDLLYLLARAHEKKRRPGKI